MRKIGELIDEIQTLYSKGVPSDDSRLSSRRIYAKLLSARARLLEQTSKKKQKVNQFLYQTLPCVELVKAEKHECPCIPAPGCSILKTKCKLPVPLSNYDTHLIQSVSSIMGDKMYSEESWKGIKHRSGNKYTASSPAYYLQGGHLYLVGRGSPSIITITGLFEDPVAAHQMGVSGCADCGEDGDSVDCTSPLDIEFALDAATADVLISMTVQELLGPFTVAQEDQTNNASDSRKEQSK